MCKHIIWVNEFSLFFKMDHHRGPMYEIKVNVFICMCIAIGDHMKEGDVIILDITNSMNYS